MRNAGSDLAAQKLQLLAARAMVGVLIVSAIGVVGVIAPSTGSAGVGARQATSSPNPDPGEAWATRYDNATGEDFVKDLVVSPDGTRVFVTGESESAPGSGSGNDFATLAYDAQTGAELWEARYDRNQLNDGADAIAVSPDGAKVFVTGKASQSPAESNGFATVAYDSADGSELWVKTFGSGGAGESSITVSPDSTTVYVTGGMGTYVTIAYDATSGSERWPQPHLAFPDSPGPHTPSDIDVSANGARIYVTGASNGVTPGINQDYGTVAINASTGTTEWASRYNGSPNGTDRATALAVDHGSDVVYVTGASSGGSDSDDYATVSYAGASGALRWARRFHGGSMGGSDAAFDVAVSPNGAVTYVTGRAVRGGSGGDIVTLAYSASDGADVWAAPAVYTSAGFGDDTGFEVKPSPDGMSLYVLGIERVASGNNDRVALAYDAGGSPRWVERRGGPGNDQYGGAGLSPNGVRLYVTASERSAVLPDTLNNYDYVTVAYAPLQFAVTPTPTTSASASSSSSPSSPTPDETSEGSPTPTSSGTGDPSTTPVTPGPNDPTTPGPSGGVGVPMPTSTQGGGSSPSPSKSSSTPTGAGPATESPSPTPSPRPTPAGPSSTECSDGADNDGDDLIDFPSDPGCASSSDADESDAERRRCARRGVIRGTRGDDVLRGTPRRDVICALAGDDVVRGRGGADLIIGGAGRDAVAGGRGNDVIAGRRGGDRLSGGRGRDTLRGGAGKDRLNGGPGRDRCSGSPKRPPRNC